MHILAQRRTYSRIVKVWFEVFLYVSIKHKYALLIISDHGNAEHAVNNDGSPNTAHTKNLVPCFLLNTNFNKIKNGKLADIAPTILKIMGINIPDEMTGETLI